MDPQPNWGNLWSLFCFMVLHSVALYLLLSFKHSFIFKIICCVFDLFKNPYLSNKSSHTRIKFVCGTDSLSLLLMNLPISVLYEAYLQGFNNVLKGNDTVKRFPLKIFCALLLKYLATYIKLQKYLFSSIVIWV